MGRSQPELYTESVRVSGIETGQRSIESDNNRKNRVKDLCKVARASFRQCERFFLSLPLSLPVCVVSIWLFLLLICSVSSSFLVALPELDSSGFVREHVHSFRHRSLLFNVFIVVFLAESALNSIRTSIMTVSTMLYLVCLCSFLSLCTISTAPLHLFQYSFCLS